MLGLGLTPALLRRAAQARDADMPARWWQPAAGTALGLFLGSLIPPGTALGATIEFLFGQGWQGIATAAILAFLGAGVVTLTAGLACLATTALPGKVPTWVTVLMTVVMSCCAAVALLPIPSFNFTQIERLYLAFVLPDDQWRWLAVLYPAAVVALAAKTVPRRSLIRPGAASLATPILAATATAVLSFPHDHTAVDTGAAAVRLAEEQWWAAALAGLAVLIVLSLGRGVPGLARACVSAWLTTLLVGVERVIYGSITGSGWHYFSFLSALLVTPSVWLFYLAVPASSLALIRARASAEPKRQWGIATAACAGAGATAAAIVITGIPGLLVPLGTPPDSQLTGSDLVHPDRLTGAPAPRSVLTDAAARVIITRAGEALPDNWTSDSTQPADASTGHSTITPAACVPFLYGEYLNTLPRPLTHVQGQYKLLPGYVDGTETLKVVVDSYAQPVPTALFAAEHWDVNACHRYKIADLAGSFTADLHRVPVHGLSVPAWRAEVSISSWTASSAITWVEIGIGHNLVILNQTTNFTGSLAQPDEAVIDAAVHAITSASATPLPAEATQPLTQAAAEYIAGAVGPHLESSWLPASVPAAPPAHVTYQPAECAALAHETYLNTLPTPLVRAEDRYSSDDGNETLSVRVESFARPVPGPLLTAASRIFRACPRFTAQSSGSTGPGPNEPSLITTHASSGSAFGFPAWRGDIFDNLDPGSGWTTWIMIVAGHNFVLISQNTISDGARAQPDGKAIATAEAATLDAMAHSA